MNGILVDPQDAHFLNQRWDELAGYAMRSKRNQIIYLHHLIIGKPSASLKVDHINGNKLDNRRSNLRIVTNAENMANRAGPNSNSTTGVLGVTMRRGPFRTKIFVAQHNIGGRHVTVGRFETLQEAAEAVATARKEAITRLEATGVPA